MRLAEHFGCPILNADSRQIYRDLPIGTAAPTAEEQARVKHYFVGTKALDEDYNAGQYERDVLGLIESGEIRSQVAILSGGSMMYIDAVCEGLDDIPEVNAAVREQVRKAYEEKGLGWLQDEVQRCDPAYWDIVDRMNPQRLMHCVEVSRSAGVPYSSFRKKASEGGAQRPFRIVKVGLDRPREELYDRINRRVQMMIDEGLEAEARRAYERFNRQVPNSLQTVGYKEMFAYFEGKMSWEETINAIQENSRHYAKRQLTWFRRDKAIHWLDARLDYETQVHIIDDWIADSCRLP